MENLIQPANTVSLKFNDWFWFLNKRNTIQKMQNDQHKKFATLFFLFQLTSKNLNSNLFKRKKY